VSEKENKPVLDQQAFEKLLEAAYVLQQHSRQVREQQDRTELHGERPREKELADAPEPPSESASAETARPADYTLTLSQIVEAQRQIQVRHLEPDKAMAVLAEKLVCITHASGAGIGILEGKIIRYRATAGEPALKVGTEVTLNAAVCAASVRTGQVIRSEDVNSEILFDPESCRQRGILSLLAVPIYHDGDVVGAIELYFGKLRGYAEQDVHTCQLMAGLVTEALRRNAEQTLKKSVAEERSSMLAAIEKLQPSLAALAADFSANGSKNHDAPPQPETHVCWKCGGKMLAQEQFCGTCGAARVSDIDTSSVQSKVASAWYKQQAAEQSAETSHAAANRETSLLQDHCGQEEDHARQEEVAGLPNMFSAIEHSLPESELLPALPDPWSDGKDLSAPDSIAASTEPAAVLLPKPEVLLPKPEDDPYLDEESLTPADALSNSHSDHQAWSSAAKTRNYLEKLAETKSASGLIDFWRLHRGDFYLALALILVVVIIRWGLLPNRSVATTAKHPTQVSGGTNQQNTDHQSNDHQNNDQQVAPEAELSTLDKLLIKLGLAEAPEPPQPKGNPDAQVWVDLHTALYYCSGSDLYGKTPKGRMTTQRDAQLDQFEPANRKPCE
jgi:GAF domain-containing protein